MAAVLSGAVLGSAFAADMPVKAKAVPFTTGPWLELYGGLVVAPNSVFGYGGAVAAFNGNLNKDGFLFRVAGGAGRYDYNSGLGLTNRVDFQTGEVMVGYQTYVGVTRLTGYVGGNVEDHNNNTDPLAIIRGTRYGFKAQGEIFAPVSPQVYLIGLVSYSTAWNTYFALGKAGYNITPVVSFGPEVTALGNDRFSAVRTGPFVAFNLTPAAVLVFSGGYSWDQKRDAFNNNSGGYGTVHIQSTF